MGKKFLRSAPKGKGEERTVSRQRLIFKRRAFLYLKVSTCKSSDERSAKGNDYRMKQ